MIFEYKTVVKEYERVPYTYKEKGSSFIAYIFYLEDSLQVKEIVGGVRKKHFDARHHCWGYRVITDDRRIEAHCSDDGEPAGTAGKPILNTIQSADLYNVLIVVVRYFGGTKLGVPGLIRAYKTASLELIENVDVITKKIEESFLILLDYENISSAMKVIKLVEGKILSQEMKEEIFCISFSIAIEKKEALFTIITDYHYLKLKEL